MSKQIEETLTEEQHIKFNILVPLVSDIVIKRQLERGSKTIQSEHERYNASVEAILSLKQQWQLEARIDEVEKVKLVTYRDEMVRYADKRIAELEAQLTQSNKEQS